MYYYVLETQDTCLLVLPSAARARRTQFYYFEVCFQIPMHTDSRDDAPRTHATTSLH